MIYHFSPSVDLDLSMHFIYMFDKMILYHHSFGHVEWKSIISKTLLRLFWCIKFNDEHFVDLFIQLLYIDSVCTRTWSHYFIFSITRHFKCFPKPLCTISICPYIWVWYVELHYTASWMEICQFFFVNSTTKHHFFDVILILLLKLWHLQSMFN